jgi:ferric-dicitrate binding protein FerR (iron transport regulator)
MSEAKLQELISKYANDNATDKEVEELMHWYRSQGIDEVEWPVETAAEPATLRRRMLERLLQDTARRKVKAVNFSWARAAAALLIFAGLASLIYYLYPSSTSYITVHNPSGKIRFLQLPDGSRVWLNAATQLKYAKDFSKHRKIGLSGEAYFQVKPDKAHPFIVESDKLETTVLGTSFNISSYSSDELTTVAVTNGLVKVAGHSLQPVQLAASEQIQVNKATGLVTTTTIDTTSALSWKEGRLQFHGQTLGEIAKKLENWYGYKIIFGNPEMARCRYYMTFKNSLSPDQLFAAMSEVANINYVIDKKLKTVTLAGSGCR